MVGALTPRQLDGEPRLDEFGLDQIALVTLNFDDAFLDGAAGAAFFLQQGGQLFLPFARDAVDGDDTGALASFVFPTQTHDAILGKGGGGAGDGLVRLRDKAAVRGVDETRIGIRHAMAPPDWLASITKVGPEKTALFCGHSLYNHPQ